MANNAMGTDVVVQLGFLVKDVQKTAQEFSDFLGQPFSISQTDTQDKAKTRYLGLSTPARCKQAFFQVGEQLQIELIEPDDQPSVWRDDLLKNGEGVHHIAFKVKGTDEVLHRLEGKGLAVLQTGQWDGGRYAYVDTKEQLKTTIELLEDLK